MGASNHGLSNHDWRVCTCCWMNPAKEGGPFCVECENAEIPLDQTSAKPVLMFNSLDMGIVVLIAIIVLLVLVVVCVCGLWER